MGGFVKPLEDVGILRKGFIPKPIEDMYQFTKKATRKGPIFEYDIDVPTGLLAKTAKARFTGTPFLSDLKPSDLSTFTIAGEFRTSDLYRVGGFTAGAGLGQVILGKAGSFFGVESIKSSGG